MTDLSLADAGIIIDQALAEGRSRALQPLAVIVLDAGGHPIAMKREDGASLLRWKIAMAKAWGTLGMGFGNREMARRAAANPAFIGAINELAGGNVVPVAGGVLVRDGSGKIVGAAGASGDMSDADEACVLAGIRAAGFVPDTGDAS